MRVIACRSNASTYWTVVVTLAMPTLSSLVALIVSTPSPTAVTTPVADTSGDAGVAARPNHHASGQNGAAHCRSQCRRELRVVDRTGIDGASGVTDTAWTASTATVSTASEPPRVASIGPAVAVAIVVPFASFSDTIAMSAHTFDVVPRLGSDRHGDRSTVNGSCSELSATGNESSASFTNTLTGRS